MLGSAFNSMGFLLLRAGVRGALWRLTIIPRALRGFIAQLPPFPRLAQETDSSIDDRVTSVDLEAGLAELQTDSDQKNSLESAESASTTSSGASTRTPTSRNEDNDDDESEYDPLKNFAHILAALNTDHIPQYALAVRQRLDPQFQGEPPKMWDPISGSYNVCFCLDFDDGTEWVIKFPMTGTKDKWTGVSARALTSEAQTMRFLKKETTIPLPEVYDFCASPDNDLNSPYIIMEYINGQPLSNLWFGKEFGDHTPEQNEEFRLRALRGVAAAMKQLSQFSFNKGGFLEFDDEGKPIDVGPMRVINYDEHKQRLLDGDDNADPAYIEVGPFTDPEDQYKVTLYYHEEKDDFSKAMKELISHLINCITENSGNMFDLAHPDLAVQNVIVSETGELRGIIDWDGIAAVPMSRGSRAYPLWLRRDWEFGHYWYKEDAVEGVSHDDFEDSPEKLREYRRLYAQYLVEAHPELETPLPDEISLLATKASLVTVTLYTAAREPLERDLFLRELMDRIDAAIAEDVDLDFFSVCHDIEDEIFDDGRLEELEDGYQELLEGDL